MSITQPSVDLDNNRHGKFPKLHSNSDGNRQIVFVPLEQGQSRALRQVARECTPPLFELLKSAWPILLAKYLGSKSISFGIIPNNTRVNAVEGWSAIQVPELSVCKAVRLHKYCEWSARENDPNDQFNSYLTWRKLSASNMRDARSDIPTSMVSYITVNPLV